MTLADHPVFAKSQMMSSRQSYLTHMISADPNRKYISMFLNPEASYLTDLNELAIYGSLYYTESRADMSDMPTAEQAVAINFIHVIYVIQIEDTLDYYITKLVNQFSKYFEIVCKHIDADTLAATSIAELDITIRKNRPVATRIAVYNDNHEYLCLSPDENWPQMYEFCEPIWSKKRHVGKWSASIVYDNKQKHYKAVIKRGDSYFATVPQQFGSEAYAKDVANRYIKMCELSFGKMYDVNTLDMKSYSGMILRLSDKSVYLVESVDIISGKICLVDMETQMKYYESFVSENLLMSGISYKEIYGDDD